MVREKMDKLPEFPQMPWRSSPIAYQTARADAWESRCRLAVEALKYVETRCFPDWSIDDEQRVDSIFKRVSRTLDKVRELPQAQP
jgi:hypothetical protein